LPSRNLFEVPENISDEAAVFTEPLAAAVEIGACRIHPDDNVAVTGTENWLSLCPGPRATTPQIRYLIGKHTRN
jgi:hypothetical protein